MNAKPGPLLVEVREPFCLGSNSNRKRKIMTMIKYAILTKFECLTKYGLW